MEICSASSRIPFCGIILLTHNPLGYVGIQSALLGSMEGLFIGCYFYVVASLMTASLMQ